ncbi:MAG TPA: SRPBCC domain-containing protein [Rhodanobacter sp.]
MRLPALALLLLLPWLPPPLHAEVKQAAPDHMLVENSRVLHVSPARAYAALPHVARWWSGTHTWSGDAANLSLDAVAGGCFCERWGKSSVQHMRVLQASQDKLLRLEGAIGPLQEMAVDGVMTFALAPDAHGTRLTFQYRVNGASASALDQLAPAVDHVLMEQLGRFQRYVETGTVGAAKP